MYLFKIIEKILAHDEEKNDKAKSKENKKTFVKNDSLVKSNENKKKYQSNPLSAQDKKEMAYCLFSDSGQSFQAMHNNTKRTIFLDNISHPNKYTAEAKHASQFINNHCKKKTVYLDIISENEKGIIAEVYLDSQKKSSLNKLLIEEGLNKSEVPVKESNIGNDEMKIVSSTPNKINNVNYTEKNNPDNLIGYLKKFGKAPYLNNPNNKGSYFITIEKDSNEKTKWGVDLERALLNSSANIGDYIQLKKNGADVGKIITNSDGQAKNSYKNLWIVEKIDDIDARYAKTDGPPIYDEMDIPFNEEDYGIQIPPYYDEPYEIHSNIQSEDPMDDILSVLDEQPKKTIKNIN